MIKRSEFTGYVKGGKAYIDDRRTFDLFISTLEGSNISLIVSSAGKKRSSQQNRYFHGVVLKYVGEAFYNITGEVEYLTNKEKVKELIKGKFLSTPIFNPESGEIIAYDIKDTRKLSPSEMENLCESVRIWMQVSFNVTIPLPSESEELFTGCGNG